MVSFLKLSEFAKLATVGFPYNLKKSEIVYP